MAASLAACSSALNGSAPEVPAGGSSGADPSGGIASQAAEQGHPFSAPAGVARLPWLKTDIAKPTLERRASRFVDLPTRAGTVGVVIEAADPDTLTGPADEFNIEWAPDGRSGRYVRLLRQNSIIRVVDEEARESISEAVVSSNSDLRRSRDKNPSWMPPETISHVIPLAASAATKQLSSGGNQRFHTFPIKVFISTLPTEKATPTLSCADIARSLTQNSSDVVNGTEYPAVDLWKDPEGIIAKNDASVGESARLDLNKAGMTASPTDRLIPYEGVTATQTYAAEQLDDGRYVFYRDQPMADFLANSAKLDSDGFGRGERDCRPQSGDSYSILLAFQLPCDAMAGQEFKEGELDRNGIVLRSTRPAIMFDPGYQRAAWEADPASRPEEGD